MDSSGEGRIIPKKTERKNLSQSVNNRVRRSGNEVIMNEDNKKVTEETLLETWDREYSMEVKNRVTETEIEDSMVESVVENEISEILPEYDEETNSTSAEYELGQQTTVGVKNIFVRKVLFIFIVEMAVTLFGSFIMFILNTRVFFAKYWYLGLAAIGIMWIFGIIVAFNREIIKKRLVRWISVPIGMILFMIAITSLMSGLEAPEIMLSHLIVDIVFLVALFFTFQWKFPFGGVYGYVLVGCLLIAGYGGVGAYVKDRHWYYVISALVGSAISTYVVNVIRLVVNGRTKEKYTIREYGCVIVLLYIDYIIRIVDGCKSVSGRKKSNDSLRESQSAQ